MCSISNTDKLDLALEISCHMLPQSQVRDWLGPKFSRLIAHNIFISMLDR